MSNGYVSDVASSLATPFSTKMTWAQLAAVVVFVLVVLFAWRQVTLFFNVEG